MNPTQTLEELQQLRLQGMYQASFPGSRRYILFRKRQFLFGI